MSHQTGITANFKLRNFLAQAKDGRVRSCKIIIEKEELTCACTQKPHGTWENDYDHAVLPLLDVQLPCYIFFRFDSKNSTGFEWLFITWCPDDAPVRQKMLYAATRATMKSQFGAGQIKDELFGTTREDASLAGYRRHVQSALAPAPLTVAEEELRWIKQNELNAHSIDSRSQTMKGVAFPLTPEAGRALEGFRTGSVNYVQLSLDLVKEVVLAEVASNIRVSQLVLQVPRGSARYHLFHFGHTHEGDFHHSNVFIYSVPGYKCSIKERMLYSSCKNPLLQQLASLGIQIDKSIEIDDPKELTEQLIYDELHPQRNVVREAFPKPKAPAGRGPRRMLRSKE